LVSHALRKANCTVHFEASTDPLELYGSPGELAQVVTNLVTNAIDGSAEKGGGPITLRLAPKNGGVEFTVSDCGAGIPLEVLPRIFDFLFTTKPVGQGTGLGLSIVHNIVTNGFGGTVSAQSEPGRGATFTLQLPSPPSGVTRDS
jgi:signal transduction histidine kinase